jgi:hypothetical protein
MQNGYYEQNPSPDCRGNPFLKKKDCSGKRETAPENNA